VILIFKGLSARRIYKSFGVKGLKWLLIYTVCMCVCVRAANNRLLHVGTENRCGKGETRENEIIFYFLFNKAVSHSDMLTLIAGR
jgi:hypothetical protein